MPEQENIHACWSLQPQYDRVTGDKTSAGLFALGGRSGDGALRELKKRCDAERELTGKPLVGCAMYVSLVMSWAKKSLQYMDRIKGTEIKIDFAADKSFRVNLERSLLLTGEDEIVGIIEETWARYHEDGTIPDAVLMDVEEDIAAILEDEYCPVGLEPPDFSPAEIEQSKVIALTLGKRKRRAKPAAPVPEEPPEESEPEPAPPEPEPEATVPDIRAEIDAKIRAG